MEGFFTRHFITVRSAIRLLILFICVMEGAGSCVVMAEEAKQQEEISFEAFPLERNGIRLHLDCARPEGTEPSGNILLLHGSSYSSHEFDINYKDYSLVRRLVREGYAVWRLDIAGYGQSGEVEDGFLPDTAYAAQDIRAAVRKIVQISGQERIDLLGWSWGTMTAGMFAGQHPEQVRKLILYAPVLRGLGEQEIGDPFGRNTWESAAEDFRKKEDGSFDTDLTDPILIELFCSACWHYDGDFSPRGWCRDVFVDERSVLIDLKKIAAPTLLIYGSRDPYMNKEALSGAADLLPHGSRLQEIEGGSHIMMYEKPYYREFQDRIVSFLKASESY